ncbi:MAG: hypothetical protein ACTHMS_12655 [Jatrophihabitans sp.]|uniref:hypothetical protein n=1 Tax=Jatrophihabitans sp. TaxID=1932789 RepID=UPI003F81602D
MTTLDVLREDTPLWTTGGVFLDALARRDFVALAGVLAPDVRFRALLPPRVVEESTADAAVDHFRRWYGDASAFSMADAAIGQVGPVLSLRWCARVTDAAGMVRELEQHVYARVDQRIVALDLLCSGMHEVTTDGR